MLQVHEALHCDRGVSTLTAVTGQPAYQQVADDLRSKILNGTYPVEKETRLPSTTDLMAIYDVSSTVVRAAIRELRTEGVVAGQPGKGVYVIKAPSQPDIGPDALDRVENLEREVEQLRRRVADLETERGGSGPSGP
ncbi:winged helix-turn-helix transcriptional regulator [Candidatus Frankia alpina]|uniref:Winged helix-turn-helix transcriptional regulator n=1 Tax=Candidatus Frankia alpina TaxID=2699483 RepID=A0A4S5EET8_9ACTN|nr:winged helix-turn-helix transcriptional regulator [Candidatus Frankia alpina]